MSEQQIPTYQTPFTKEAIVDLSNHLTVSLKAYAKEKGTDDKIDLFVILAALGQVGFEVSYGSLAATKEEKDKLFGDMKKVTNDLLRKLDAIHIEHGTQPSADLVAAPHLMSLLAEFYVTQRDKEISKIVQESATAEVSE